MNILTPTATGCALIAAAMFLGCANQGNVKPQPKTQVLKVHAPAGAPRSLIVKAGDTVVLSAPAVGVKILPATTPRFQWTKDDAEIADQEKPDHTITDVNASHAGKYVLFDLKGRSRVEYPPIYLSVYSEWEGHSNGGTLTAPIGDFTSGSTTVTCDGVSRTYDRYKAYFPFDGPGTRLPSPTFPNTGQGTNLTVDTCTNLNNRIDTGIIIKNNFTPPSPPTQRACSHDADCGLANTNLSKCTVRGLETNKTFRVTIFFNSRTLGTNTTVSFNWKYNN